MDREGSGKVFKNGSIDPGPFTNCFIFRLPEVPAALEFIETLTIFMEKMAIDLSETFQVQLPLCFILQ